MLVLKTPLALKQRDYLVAHPAVPVGAPIGGSEPEAVRTEVNCFGLRLGEDDPPVSFGATHTRNKGGIHPRQRADRDRVIINSVVGLDG